MKLKILFLFLILSSLLLAIGCNNRNLYIQDKLQKDTLYHDLRPNDTYKKGEGRIFKIMNATDETENLTYTEDMRE